MMFKHIGVVTDTPQENESYAEDLKVFITDPEESEFKFEYLRFQEGSPMPKEIQNNPHVAFQVEKLEPYMESNRVLVEPFMVGDNLRITFVIKDGMVMELMEEL